jgi:DnaJ-class molecular chaperone
LCVAKLKILYDQHGEDVLRLGVKDQHGDFKGGYIYQQNCYEIFDNFFLHHNPFHNVSDSTGEKLHGSMFGSAFGGGHAPGADAAKDVQVEVPCSLLEFYHGAVKLVVYKRQTLALDGHTVREEGEECVKTVIVKAGMGAGTKLKYKGEGNQQYKKPSTDLIVTLVDDTSAQTFNSLPEAAR